MTQVAVYKTSPSAQYTYIYWLTGMSFIKGNKIKEAKDKRKNSLPGHDIILRKHERNRSTGWEVLLAAYSSSLWYIVRFAYSLSPNGGHTARETPFSCKWSRRGIDPLSSFLCESYSISPKQLCAEWVRLSGTSQRMVRHRRLIIFFSIVQLAFCIRLF